MQRKESAIALPFSINKLNLYACKMEPNYVAARYARSTFSMLRLPKD